MENDSKNNPEDGGLKFICPNCGTVTQDEVIFLCNVCKQEDMVYKDGAYMCPKCFEPGENFECYSCGSKSVKLKSTND